MAVNLTISQRMGGEDNGAFEHLVKLNSRRLEGPLFLQSSPPVLLPLATDAGHPAGAEQSFGEAATDGLSRSPEPPPVP
jgi:hypothetical protein